MNVKNKLIGAAVALCAASLLTIAPISASAAGVHHSMKGMKCLIDGKAVKAKSAKACEKKGGEVVKKAKKHRMSKKAKKADDAQMQSTTSTTTTTVPAQTQPAAQ